MSEPMEVAVIVVEPAASPEPLMKGTFAIYPLPDGGRVIAYRAEGEAESQQIPIPAVIMRLWEAQARGEKVTPMQMMKAVMGN